MSVISPQIDVHIDQDSLEQALRRDVSEGLRSTPKRLPPKWFYDERGSELFDQITRLPEYYLTRREREILYSEAATLARLTNADTLVEIGSGTSEKTLLILDALHQRGGLSRYVPFDVSEPTLRHAAHGIAERYPGVAVHAVVGDFGQHLKLLPSGDRRIVAFLGSTIGNLDPFERDAFLTALRKTMSRDDWLLLGTDLVKDVTRLESAYNDASGVTAQFNLNILSVINRSLNANFDVRGFEHIARFDTENEWVEMTLRSRVDQSIRLEALEQSVSFAADERMRTEISAKFRPERVERELELAGFVLERWWTDSQNDFALSLSRPH